MQVNKINNTTTTFGVKINGKMSFDICQDMYSNGKSKLSRAYVDKFESLQATGSPDSEIYLLKDAKGAFNFVLKNPKITTAYEIFLGKIAPKKLLESFLNIKTNDILKAEEEMKSLINAKKDFVLQASFKDQELKKELLQKGKADSVEEVINKLDDNTIIDTFYNLKNKVK